jgi:hypothetical protein
MSKKSVEGRFLARRQFLVGAGSSLALPPLLSIMSRAEAQTVMSAKRQRLVLLGTSFGLHRSSVSPRSQVLGANVTTVTELNGTPVPKFRYAQLNSLGADVSYMANPFLARLANDMNVFEGLDQSSWANGDHCVGFFAGSESGPSPSNQNVMSLHAGRTIDCSIPESAAFRASFRGSRPVVRNSNYSHFFSFDRVKGANGQLLPGMQNSFKPSSFVDDRSMFCAIFGCTASTPTPTPGVNRNQLLIDRVKADLDRLKAHPRLSEKDRFALGSFAEGVYQVESGLSGPTQAAAECRNQRAADWTFALASSAGKSVSDGLAAYWKNVSTMIYLAFKCDLTRISSIGLFDVSRHHQIDDSAAELYGAKYKLEFLKAVVDNLILPMKDTVDPFATNGESMLDNSLAVFHSDHEGRAVHSGASVPVITFGQLGGKVRSGYFMNFRNDALLAKGRPYEQRGYPAKMLMVSIMKAMGMTREEILREGDGSGFGHWNWVSSYSSLAATEAYPQFFHTNQNHSLPLPFFTKDWTVTG